MNLFRRLSLLTLLFLASAVFLNLAQAQEPTGLFTPATAPAGMADHNRTILRERFVTLNLNQLQANQATLTLPLFNDVQLVAKHTRTDQFENGAYVWVGTAENTIYSDISLSVNGDIVLGTFNLMGASYRLEYVKDGVHVIRQVPLDGGEELQPLEPDPAVQQARYEAELLRRAQTPSLVGPTVDDGSQIDVLVLYTPAVASEAGGTAAAQALINLAVAESNTGFDSSGVNMNMNLVHMTEVAYIENGDFYTDLERVTEPADGFIDNAHTLRDAYQADFVVLLIQSDSLCGLAWLMSNMSVSFAPSAFSVTAGGCATGYYSFAHEIGHNMGSNHDRANANNAVFSYSYGYQDPEAEFRTIMAYNCPGGCTRQNHWSNPHVNYSVFGPTGVDCNLTNSADNRYSINAVAYTVSNFRSSTLQADPAGGGLLYIYLPILYRPEAVVPPYTCPAS